MFLHAPGVHRYGGGGQRLTEKLFNLPAADGGVTTKKHRCGLINVNTIDRASGVEEGGWGSLLRAEKRPTAAPFVGRTRGKSKDQHPVQFLSFRID